MAPRFQLFSDDDTAVLSNNDGLQTQGAQGLPDVVSRQAMNELSHQLLQMVSRLCFPPMLGQHELRDAQV